MSNAPSPALLFQTVNAYQRTAAIRAAVELDVFTAIAEGNRTPADIAARTSAAERGVRILCDSLVIFGFLTKDAAGYALTQDSAVFLDKRSPAYAGGVIGFLLTPSLTGAFEHLTDAVRTGRTALPPGGTVAPDHPVWVEFARSMAGLMAMPAQILAQLVDGGAKKPLKILDVAGGHGLFGVALAKLHPQSTVTCLDWPNVLAVAQDNATAANLGNRFRQLPGSAFDVEWGAGYDVVLLTNFLHHFDEPGCVTLLQRAKAALAPAGRAVALEFIPDADRTTPPDSAAFALIMLATTPAGDAYTFADLHRMYTAAGFAKCDLHELPPTFQRVVIGA